MIYSIHTSAEHAVESALGEIDSSSGKRKMPECITKITEKNDWNMFTRGDSFYGREGTDGVAKNFYKEHSYESKITSSISKNIITNDFYQMKFTFCPRQTVGSIVDVQRYLSGDPRCWYSMKRKRVKRMSLRVFAPIGGTYEITRKDMEVCGALTCSVVEILESNGIGVELWTACVASNVCSPSRNERDSDCVCTMIKIKDVDQYCDYGMVNYITGDSYFYRNIVFKDRILACSSRGRHYRGVGRSYDFSRDLIPHDEEYDSALDIVVPRKYSIDSAKQWISEEFISKCNSICEGAVLEE